MARHGNLSRVYLGGGPGDEALQMLVEQRTAFNIIALPGRLTAVDQPVTSLGQCPTYSGYVVVEDSVRRCPKTAPPQKSLDPGNKALAGQVRLLPDQTQQRCLPGRRQVSLGHLPQLSQPCIYGDIVRGYGQIWHNPSLM
jgi:hypothetical protein